MDVGSKPIQAKRGLSWFIRYQVGSGINSWNSPSPLTSGGNRRRVESLQLTLLGSSHGHPNLCHPLFFFLWSRLIGKPGKTCIIPDDFPASSGKECELGPSSVWDPVTGGMEPLSLPKGLQGWFHSGSILVLGLCKTERKTMHHCSTLL